MSNIGQKDRHQGRILSQICHAIECKWPHKARMYAWSPCLSRSLPFALRAAPAHTSCLCRMGTVARQLEQLNKELAAKCLEVDAAFEAYNIAAAATTRAAIALAGAPSDKRLQVLHDGAQEEEHWALGRYEDLKKNKERLLEAARALHAKLPNEGERTRLLPCQQHQAL